MDQPKIERMFRCIDEGVYKITSYEKEYTDLSQLVYFSEEEAIILSHLIDTMANVIGHINMPHVAIVIAEYQMEFLHQQIVTFVVGILYIFIMRKNYELGY